MRKGTTVHMPRAYTQRTHARTHARARARTHAHAHCSLEQVHMPMDPHASSRVHALVPRAQSQGPSAREGCVCCAGRVVAAPERLRRPDRRQLRARAPRVRPARGVRPEQERGARATRGAFKLGGHAAGLAPRGGAALARQEAQL
eukprot:4766140-Pleurochrysis_carterae.AAC.1